MTLYPPDGMVTMIKEKEMNVEVSLNDLYTVREALDDAATSEVPNIEGIVNTLDKVQTYIDNAENAEADDGNETTEVQDSGDNTSDSQAYPVESVVQEG